MVLMTPRNNITALSTNPFEGFVSFDCIPLLNAIIEGCVSLFNVISLYPVELMNLATLSLVHGS